MNVADLAEELDLAPSTVLDHCQRFDIDATWAGAELSQADVAVLQAELAANDRTEPSPVLQGAGAPAGPHRRDGPVGPEDRDAPTEPGGPTLRPAEPRIQDELDDRVDVDLDAQPSVPGTRPAEDGPVFSDLARPSPASVSSAPGGPASLAPPTIAEPAPGTGPHVDPAAPGVSPAASVVPPRRTSAQAVNPHLERHVRASIVALVVAAGLFVGATFIDNVWIVAAVWLIAAIVIVTALSDSLRGWYRASTHPDQVNGHYLSIGLVIVSVAAAVGLGLGVWTVVRSAPASTAPLGIGDNASVKHLRWGYKRVLLVKSIGWNRPSKDPGTCWLQEGKQRRSERVEMGFTQTSCSDSHRIEVLDVLAVNKDADARYPGKDKLVAKARDRCAARLMRINTATDKRPAVGATFAAEYPTEAGWRASDHSVACVALAAPRRGSLSS